MGNRNVISTHHFTFNPSDNGGESLVLQTSFISSGDGGVYLEQKLQLNSYTNSATFNLAGATMTSSMLRQLADEIETAENDARIKAKQI